MYIPYTCAVLTLYYPYSDIVMAYLLQINWIDRQCRSSKYKLNIINKIPQKLVLLSQHVMLSLLVTVANACGSVFECSSHVWKLFDQTEEEEEKK